MTRESLARKLRVLRAKQGLTKKAVAERAGISRPTVAALEQGAQDALYPTLEKLAKAYGVPVEELVEDEPVYRPPLSLAHMLREQDVAARRRALEASSPEQVGRYLRDVDRAVLGAGTQLRSPDHQEPGEQEGLERYMQALLELREEADPYIGVLPPTAQEMALHASAGAA
jgi:transcriptional regulator with XRE-family HTH domain